MLLCSSNCIRPHRILFIVSAFCTYDGISLCLVDSTRQKNSHMTLQRRTKQTFGSDKFCTRTLFVLSRQQILLCFIFRTVSSVPISMSVFSLALFILTFDLNLVLVLSFTDKTSCPTNEGIHFDNVIYTFGYFAWVSESVLCMHECKFQHCWVRVWLVNSNHIYSTCFTISLSI